MTCPEGFTAAQVNVHGRDPDTTVTLWACVLPEPP